MPSLQVREMPTVLYGALQESAKREHRSIAQQAIVTLARGIGLPDDHNERRRSLLTTIKESNICPNNLKVSSATSLVKEDRKR